MLDLKNLEVNGLKIKQNVEQRNFFFDLDTLLKLQNEIKNLQQKIELLNKERKTNQDTIRGKEIKHDLDILNNALDIVLNDWNEKVAQIPNLLEETVPIGKGEEYNKTIKMVQATKNKDEIYNQNINRNLIDTEAGAKLAGTRFNVLRGEAAKLQRKLINNALDFYTEKEYEEVYVPNLVLPEIMFGTGQYPKFKEDLFQIDKHYLIPTGEVPVTNLYREQIIPLIELQQTIKLMTHTPCFRKEAGANGKDTKGLMRQHQFEKVELVKICHPENARNEFELMLNDIEDFVLTLNIDYRIIELCTGDIGFAGHKAYDIELFFEEENRYREIASITWCGDFQARRMQTKFKENGKTNFVHTINGTGLAAGRILEAIAQKND